MSIKVLLPSIDLVEEYLPGSKKIDQLYNLSGDTKPVFIENIRFENVSFGYDLKNLIFDNVSMIFPVNKIVAIVGKTGSGKSSISKLLMGFYHQQSGSIFIDNLDLSDIDIHLWRKKIGYVEQEPFFFNGSILENLTHGDDLISEDMINNALEVSHCVEFMDKLPNGILTLIGDKGSRLSGGQKARLALARAIIGESEILLLDEVTSALDKETEMQIIDSLTKLKESKTIILITHDHEVLRIADRIYKIENKRSEMVPINC
jgi:ABC-type bacteriocin/lantibiotic exporter with double-glycine peptidase domain